MVRDPGATCRVEGVHNSGSITLAELKSLAWTQKVQLFSARGMAARSLHTGRPDPNGAQGPRAAHSGPVFVCKRSCNTSGVR